MIVQGASGVEAEVPFRLFDNSTGSPITDKGSGGNPWVLADATTTAELLVNLPGSGVFVNTTVANIVNKGRGFYALRLTALQTATAGAVYLDHAIAAASAYGYQESIIAGLLSPAQTAAAVLDAARPVHVLPGSVGEGLAIAAGLLQGNCFMDNVTNTANGQTAARLRVFHTGAEAAAATPGGIGQGEFATFEVATAYAGPNQITTHRVVQQ